MKVTNLIQTCVACPAQWEGHIEDGRMFYCRYRWGNLSITISEKPTTDVMEAMDEELYYETLGGHFAGEISEDDLIEKMEGIGFKFKGLPENKLLIKNI